MLSYQGQAINGKLKCDTYEQYEQYKAYSTNRIVQSL
jgi:hypothetical protein